MLLSASELERGLRDLLGQVDRFAPTHASCPDRWHCEKSELRLAIIKLIEGVGGSVTRSPMSFRSDHSRDSGARHVRVAGRTIPITRRDLA